MLFTYESDAMKREVYYKTLEGEHDPSDMYEMWLEYDREKTLKQYMIDKKL